MDTGPLEREASAIHQEADAAKARLVDGKNEPLYSPAEEKRRADEIEARRESRLAEMVEKAGERAATEREKALKELAPLMLSPLYTLPTMEAERAAALLPFARLEADHSDLETLAEKARTVAAVRNQTIAAIWQQVVAARLEAETQAARRSGQLPTRELHELRAALEALEAVIWDKAARAKKDDLLQRQMAAEDYAREARRLGKTDNDLKNEAARLGVDPRFYIAAARNGGGE